MSEEAVTTESTEAAVTPEAVEATAAPEAVEASSDAAPAQAQATPEWKPSYKFKVKDTEHEFDEWVRPVVKDKETEEKLRDLYSKAYGIEEVKADRQSLKEKYSELETKSQHIDSSLKQLGDYIRKGNFDKFFEEIQLPKEKVLQYALNELKIMQLPEAERAQIEADKAREAQFEQIQNQNLTLQQQHEKFVVEQVKRDISFELAKPEVSQVALSFDERVGKPGAFQQEVLKRGAYYESVHKTTPPAQQVVQEVLQLVGFQMANGNSAINTQAAAATPAPAAKKPVIPSFNGSGSTSPTRKVVQSIADIRALGQQLSARE